MGELRQQLVRSLAAEGVRAVAYDPDAREFEAFVLGNNFGHDQSGTGLLDPLQATTLNDALAEVTARGHWDRGDRLGVRELGDKIDLLHVYAVRRTDTV